MDILTPTLVLYLVVGLGVAGAVYVTHAERKLSERWMLVSTAVPFWPIYLPLLLVHAGPARPPIPKILEPDPRDDMAVAIGQVDAELERALNSLDGWAEDVLAREKTRIQELRSVWTCQADRIRQMDRLLDLPDYALSLTEPEASPEFDDASDLAKRLWNSRQARQHNVDRLRHIRRRAYDDLMGTLAWVRELVSMIHLAKFTGAPAARADELVAQIAAAVEGISETTWQSCAREDALPTGDVGDNT